ncbi:MAG: glutamate racemase [Desulfomicrobiaceae bacterium]|jgi:glutamate racemase
MTDLPIGVFDSGIGGLTVLRALRKALPSETFLYLGDTARLPYGTKSRETVVRYAVQSTRALWERGIKLLVVACNTASAAALDALRAAYPGLPVVGVVGPGAEAACQASRTGHIAVLATEGTVRGKSYEREILARRPEARVYGQPCQLFVALAEEGWFDGEVTRRTAEAYIRPLLAQAPVDTIVLGCTHFPVLAHAIAAAAGPKVTLVDSAQITARFVTRILEEDRLATPRTTPGAVAFFATDSAERFARVGSLFLGEPIDPNDVTILDL